MLDGGEDVIASRIAAPAATRQVQEAAILELQLTQLGWQTARLYPLLLFTECQPALATGQDAADIHKRILSISAGFGANLAVDGEALKISK